MPGGVGAQSAPIAEIARHRRHRATSERQTLPLMNADSTDQEEKAESLA